jgi:ketosteroid isomerase-like protein
VIASAALHSRTGKEVRMKAGLAWTALMASILSIAPPASMGAGAPDDKDIVAALDTRYQAAVKNHDVQSITEILARDFVLVTGNGRVFSKADILGEARDTAVVYDRQEDSHQTVRVWQNTAVVTALLWAKGTDSGKPFDYQLWFSDMYIRTTAGWRYVFGQASLRLPVAP